MADNTELNSGSGGDTIASDDIAGVKHQRVKIQYGADGSATDVSDAAPLPIDDAGGSLTVDNADITTLAGAVSGSEMQVDIVADGAGLATSANQLADGHNVTVDNAAGAAAVNVQDGGNSLTVDGTVTANLSATDNAVLDTIAANQLADGHAVTVDNASGASAVNIQDGGNSITVDGTVTANLSATDNAVLDTINTNTGNTDTNTTDLPNVIGTDGSAGPSSALSVAGTESGGTLQELRTDSDGHLQVDVLSGGGSGTQYTEDDAAAANPVGGVQILVRDDAPGALTTTDGDNVARRGTDYGAAFTQIVDSSGNFVDSFGGSGGTAAADDADFTAGSTQGTPAMGVYESSPSSVTDGDLGMVGISADRRLNVDAQIVGQDADVTIADGGNSITVDGTVTANLGATDNAVLDTIAANQLADGHNVTIDNASGASAVNIQDGGNSITVDGTVTANLSATDNAVLDTIAGAVSGSEMQVDVVAALPAGTGLVGDVGLSGARTSGGTTLYKNIDVDQTEDQVKGSGGQVYWIAAYNLSAAVKYLKFYNATAASVTVGTTVPDLTFPLPTQGDTNGAGFVLAIPNGIAFGTAITIAATTGLADADSGAPGANEVVVMLGYA